MLKAALEHALTVECVASAVLSLTVVDNATIHVLNRTHLKHDYPTDVISFPLDWNCEEDSLETRLLRCEGRAAAAAIEGEIVVSVDYAQEMAARCGWSTQDELTLYAIHGMLHICGYDDLTSQEKEIMRSRERAILNGLGLNAQYPDDGLTDDDEPPGATSLQASGQIDHSEGTLEDHS
ncbi:MAG: rRNA maturation RNase YbeY [Planctomycetaceae bacterium]